jgi:hypothetical protein
MDMADWEVVVWQDMREVIAMRFDNMDDATSMRSTLLHMYGTDDPNVLVLMHETPQHPIYCIFHEAVRVKEDVITEKHEGRPMPFVYTTADPGVAEALPPMEPAPTHWMKQYFNRNVAVLTWTSEYGIQVAPAGKYELRDWVVREWHESHEWDYSHDEDFLIAQLERRIRDKRGRR